MRIKLLTLMAGPAGAHNAGQIIDISETQAKELIQGGYAVACEIPVKKAVVVETATVQPPENTMAEHEVRKRKKT
ncbi:MAG: hypothetical protein BroJett002_37310 [Candidatus Brocadia sinica]|nr:MAG: hypothetical protein BroJett002_37310 [Candidatus Brocadia sinica]